MRRRRSAIRIAGPRVRVGPRGVRVTTPRVRVRGVPGAHIARRAIRRSVGISRRPYGTRRGCLGLLPGCLVPVLLLALAAVAHQAAMRPR